MGISTILNMVKVQGKDNTRVGRYNVCIMVANPDTSSVEKPLDNANFHDEAYLVNNTDIEPYSDLVNIAWNI